MNTADLTSSHIEASIDGVRISSQVGLSASKDMLGNSNAISKNTENILKIKKRC
jgi:hypothetical protein